MGKCAKCGHTEDWHRVGDTMYQVIFGRKPSHCHHTTRDKTLPIWRRRAIRCPCKGFKKQIAPNNRVLVEGMLAELDEYLAQTSREEQSTMGFYDWSMEQRAARMEAKT